MSKPNMIQGCPPGLEYLSQINKILVRQQMNVLEGLSFCFISF